MFNDEDIAKDNVVFMSANMDFLQQILGSEDKCRIVEEGINRYGLEHLITVIGVQKDKYHVFWRYNDPFIFFVSFRIFSK